MDKYDLRIGEYIDYWFEDEETGEQFFVEVPISKDHCDYTEYISLASAIASDHFDAPKLVDVVDQEEAEMWGFDTY